MHDRDGNLLAVGDRVVIEAHITAISEGEQYCNCTVATVEPMPPYNTGTSVTLNTKQVVGTIARRKASAEAPTATPADTTETPSSTPAPSSTPPETPASKE